MTAKNDLFDYLLRLGDSGLILGQRLGEWCGHAPVLEVDIALTNTALDLIGQANALLGYAGETEGKGRDADKLAFTRDGFDFRNLLICERPNGDFAQTIARQFLFDAWQAPTLAALAKGADRRLADIAAKALKEATYHLRHSGEWVVRLGDGTAESKQRMQAAIDGIWMYTGEMFEADALHQRLQQAGIAPDQEAVRAAWNKTIADVLADATLMRPTDGWMQQGGIAGRHSEHLGHMLSEMQFLQRAYPNSQW
jgi:ring-1,2-phenylacetyl-CoA epoxidase subunit PaaC